MSERGSGSIVELPDGRYRVVVTMADGRRVWRRAKDKATARRIRAELVAERELGLDPTRWTTAGFLRSWIEELRDARNQRIRATTLRHYTGIVEGHIIPGLDPTGRLGLRALDEQRVQRWLDAERGSSRSRHHYRAVLRRALNVAVRRHYIPSNPALSVELPEVRRDSGNPLSADEARRLLASTRDDRLGFLWRLAIMTGLREAELLGLGWDDIQGEDDGTRRGGLGEGTPERDGPGDVRRGVRTRPRPDRPPRGVVHDAARDGGAVDSEPRGGTVTVTSQLQRLNGQWVRTPTKAARSLERIAIDADTMAAFEAHRRRMADERKPDWPFWGLVFVTPRGTPYHGRNLLDRFHEALDKAGIRRRRFHDLRGTNATLLRNLGVSEDARMARLGHNTKSMSRHYALASETQDRAAVERLAEGLG